ncbi:MAG TPA: hypothetical protein PLK58_03000 [Candidatus Rifleibacterium sp.]|nr:hypothetical protein [Candidatus Rifleibacterium sp.]
MSNTGRKIKTTGLLLFFGLIFCCSAVIASRQREQLAEPDHSSTLTGVLVAAPLFEKIRNDWEPYKRQSQDPVVEFFGGDGDMLSYGRSAFAEGKDPDYLIKFRQVAGKYLQNSKTIKDTLRARQTARWIIYRELTSGTDQAEKAVNPDIKAVLRQWVDEPLLLLPRTSIPGMQSSGPHAVPYPLAVYNDKNECVAFDSFFIVIDDSEERQAHKIPFNVVRSVENDTLDLVVCHELAHGIMFDAYCRPHNRKVGNGPSIHGHTTDLITDREKAWLEGWAEAFEAFYGRNRKITRLGESHYGIASFLIDRQDSVRRDRWLWLTGRANQAAQMKNAAQMMASEGVIAGLIFDILSNRALVSPFEKSITVMTRRKPKDFAAFVNAWLELFPGDRRTMLRIILEHTKYATFDSTVSALYQEFYRARRAMQTRKGNNTDAQTAEKAYLKAKEEAFAKAFAGANPFSALPPQLWIGIENLTRKDGKVIRMARLNIDLNSVDAFLLEYSGLFAKPQIAEFLAAREKQCFFRGKPIDALRSFIGEERWKKLPDEGVKFYPELLQP